MRPDQLTACGQQRIRLPKETFEMGKCPVILPWQSQKNAKAILKTYELFVYGDKHYFTNLFRINMLKITT
jgi:hypothetical protein